MAWRSWVSCDFSIVTLVQSRKRLAGCFPALMDESDYRILSESLNNYCQSRMTQADSRDTYVFGLSLTFYIVLRGESIAKLFTQPCSIPGVKSTRAYRCRRVFWSVVKHYLKITSTFRARLYKYDHRCRIGIWAEKLRRLRWGILGIRGRSR